MTYIKVSLSHGLTLTSQSGSQLSHPAVPHSLRTDINLATAKPCSLTDRFLNLIKDN